MKRHTKLYELLLILMIIVMGFMNPITVNITVGGNSGSVSSNGSNTVDGVNASDTVNNSVNNGNASGATGNNTLSSGNVSGTAGNNTLGSGNTSNTLDSGNASGTAGNNTLGSGNTSNTLGSGNTSGSTGNNTLGSGNTSGTAGNNTPGSGNTGNVYVADSDETLDADDIIDSSVVSQSSKTDLTTVVPAVVDIVIIGPGFIAHGGKIYGDNNRIQTTDMTFKMSTIEGYKIGQVYWNSVDVTAKLKSGVLKLSDIESGVLKAIFVPIPSDEQQEEKQSCCCGGGKCKCKGKCKCEACHFAGTADNIDMAYYFALAMFISVIVFVLTLNGRKVCLTAREGRRYRKRSEYSKYKRLRV